MSKEMAAFFDRLAPDWDNALLKSGVREKYKKFGKDW